MMNDEIRKLAQKAADALHGSSEEDRIAVLKGMQSAGRKFMLTDEEFNQAFMVSVDQARDRGEDELMMQINLFGKHRKDKSAKGAIMPVMFGDWPPEGMTKQEAMQAIGVMFHENFPEYFLTTVVHMAEAWMVKRSKDAPEEDLHIAPSDSPNRESSVHVFALSMDQRKSWYSGKIIEKEGKPTRVEDVNMNVYDPDNPTASNVDDRLVKHVFAGWSKAFQKTLEGEGHGAATK